MMNRKWGTGRTHLHAHVRFSLVLTLLMVASATTSVADDYVPGNGGWTIIHAGTLLAVPGQKPVSNRSIVVHGGRVESIRKGFVDPDDIDSNGTRVRVVDLSSQFVLPGLIDVHVHLTNKPNRNRPVWLTTVSAASQALYGAHYANVTLLAGFTTVRNTGATTNAIYALRDAINIGLVPGPRMKVSGGMISATGGHGDKSTGFREELHGLINDTDGVCDGIESCRRAVRYQIKKGSDWIKIMATGGVNSESDVGTGLEFFEDTLTDIVKTAHAFGRRATAHAHGADGINAALRAGVDSIEHGSFVNEESFRLFKETGAVLVPTMSVSAYLLENIDSPELGLSETVKKKARATIPAAKENIAKAYKAGVEIAFGTDAGVPPHGENWKEFVLLVNDAGMSEMDAIKAATVNAAALLGLSDVVGTVEPGKYADIVSTRADPLADISAFQSVDFVMKEGVVFKNK